MTIIPITGPTSQVARASLRRAGASLFAVPDDTSGTKATGDAESVSALSLATMLSLQEIEPDAERDRRAHRHAEDILEELRGLQLDHLGAAPDPDRLARLARLSQNLPDAASPGLRQALHSVGVRAAVELARLEMTRVTIEIPRRG
jgi:hypothetical protein